MKPQSAKAKGRKFCKEVVAQIRKKYGRLEEDDISVRSSGAPGEDILLSPKARMCFPFSIECKCCEKVHMEQWYDQAKANAKGHTPIVVWRRNNREPLVVLSFKDFLACIP